MQIHSHAIVESSHIGQGTRVWAFAHILPGARIGEDCNICDAVFIEDDVIIGDRVTIKCGVQLWDGLRVSDDVFIGPNATFTNDRFVRSKQYPDRFETTTIKQGATVGANATILPGVTIGRYASIGAGAVVTSDVPDNALVIGNPARIVGYVDQRGIPIKTTAADAKEVDDLSDGVHSLGVGAVKLYQWAVHKDLRGSLSVASFCDVVPFQPSRFFMVYNVPGKDVRGAHGHRTCEQFLVCVTGSVDVVVDDGQQSRQVRLDKPNLGIYLPALIWSVQYKHSSDAVVLAFASEPYDPNEYIREYSEFQELVREHN
jgi:UDP-2-acetamido-3-amino-2,3-dideoxy-glucuronate N-acetyltransferase